jgi:hypothetical protein
MSATDRQRAEELLHIANTATAANHDGENPEAALLIAEAQVHATLAVAQALEPAEWAAPAKPTGWVYRITVDKYPTEDGKPFDKQAPDLWMNIVHNHLDTGADDNPEWVPAHLEEWMYLWSDDPYSIADEGPRIGKTVYDNDNRPMLKIPVLRRRHWLSRSTALGIVDGLRDWGCDVRLERCPLNAWEAIA